MACTGQYLGGCCEDPGGPLWSYLRAVVSGFYYWSAGNPIPSYNPRIGWLTQRETTIVTTSGEAPPSGTAVITRRINPCSGAVTVTEFFDPSREVYLAAFTYSQIRTLLSLQTLANTQSRSHVLEHRESAEVDIDFVWSDAADPLPMLASVHAKLADAAFGERWVMNANCGFTLESSGAAPVAMGAFPVSAAHTVDISSRSGVGLTASKARATFEGSYGIAVRTQPGSVISECVSVPDVPPAPPLRHTVDISPNNTGLVNSDRSLWLCPPATRATIGRPACACV